MLNSRRCCPPGWIDITSATTPAASGRLIRRYTVAREISDRFAISLAGSESSPIVDRIVLYITNLPREEFLPSDLATLYRCRWEVETLFSESKKQYELDEFNTSNLDVVEILLYAALLPLLVSRELLDLVTDQADYEIVFPPERLAVTFRPHAQLILHELGEFLGYSPPPLLERLIEDAQKIHQQRTIFQETFATATQPRCES